MERALGLGRMQALHDEGNNWGGQEIHGMGLCWRVEGFMGEQEAGRKCQKALKVRLSREGRSAN